jgi:dolichol-phosphate mannosyltransferase
MTIVFLPAYNEESAILPLLERFDAAFRAMKEPYRVVVLDDGSSDGTADAVRAAGARFPVELIQHAENEGLGRTMADGFAHVATIAGPEDTVVTMDCDDTHDPAYLPKAYEKLREGYDAVILSRYQQGGGERGLSAVRSALSRGAGLFLKLFFPIRGVWEYSCGYRVLRASAVRRLVQTFGEDLVSLPHRGFVVTPELLVKMRLLGLKIAEVGFVLNYGQKKGKSKNRPLRTIGGYFELVWRFAGKRSAARC